MAETYEEFMRQIEDAERRIEQLKQVIDGMKMREKPIAIFSMALFDDFRSLEKLVSVIYNETGRKASVQFRGSKGYLNQKVIVIEGVCDVVPFLGGECFTMCFYKKGDSGLNIKIYNEKEKVVFETTSADWPKKTYKKWGDGLKFWGESKELPF
jgi:hypothetical protein